MIIGNKNTTNSFIVYKDTMLLLNPSYTDFVLRINDDFNKKNKYVLLNFVCYTTHYLFTFQENSVEDLPNGIVSMKVADYIGDIFQSVGYETDETLMYRVYKEKIKII